MTSQIRPDELIRILRPEFLSNYSAPGGKPPAWEWYKILVVHYDPAADPHVEVFPVTDAGLAAAILVANTRDTIIIPPGTFINDYVFPSTIKVHGAGSISTYFTGQITGPAGGYIRDIRIQRTANDASTLLGLIVPATGTLAIHRVVIDLTQTGSGAARAIQSALGGTIAVETCYIEVDTVDGTALGAYCAGGSTITIDNTDTIARSVSGIGYGVGNASGVIQCESGHCEGSTARAGLL